MTVNGTDLTIAVGILAFSFTIISGLVVYVWNSSLKKTSEEITSERLARQEDKKELKESIESQNRTIAKLSEIAKDLQIIVAVHENELKKAS